MGKRDDSAFGAFTPPPRILFQEGSAGGPIGEQTEVALIYRMRIYQAVTDNLEVFHDFFRTHLLPVQLLR